MNIAVRIALLVMAGLIVSLGLIFGLNALKFDRKLHELTEGRAQIVVGEIGRTLQAAVDLGLSIEALESGSKLREHAREKDTAVLDLILFDADGRIVDSGEAGARGTTIAPVLLERFRNSKPGERWTVREDSRLLAGIPLDTTLGLRAGGAILVFSLADTRERSEAARATLALAALAALVVMVILALPGCQLFARHLHKFLDALERRFAASDSDADDDARTRALPEGLARLSETFSSRTKQIEDDLARAELAAQQGPR
ncbi:MAG: hypothetical protein AB7N54_02885 [Alphaproteobacteria bacterium]